MSDFTEIVNVDLIMLSKFGKNDGGRETWAYNFLPELVKDKNILVNVFGYRNENEKDNSSILSILNKEQIKPHILAGKKSRFPRFLMMLHRMFFHSKRLGTNRPDYVVAMGVLELIMVLLIPRFKRSHRVVWLRTIFIHEKSYKIPKYLIPLLRKLEFMLLRSADVLLSNGDDIKSYYSDYGLNVKVIKNSVDVSIWGKKPPKLSEVIKVAYVGRLNKEKGIESFIRLIEIISKTERSNNFQFHIVGDGASYLSQIEKLNSHNVIYHGAINNEDLPEFLNTIDVCVALTFASPVFGGGGTSNALLEQMAASRIILAWDNIIFQQLLDDDNSYLVEQYSCDGLALALEDIYFNNNKAVEKAKKAKDAVTPYTISTQVSKFKDYVFFNQ